MAAPDPTLRTYRLRFVNKPHTEVNWTINGAGTYEVATLDDGTTFPTVFHALHHIRPQGICHKRWFVDVATGQPADRKCNCRWCYHLIKVHHPEWIKSGQVPLPDPPVFNVEDIPFVQEVDSDGEPMGLPPYSGLKLLNLPPEAWTRGKLHEYFQRPYRTGWDTHRSVGPDPEMVRIVALRRYGTDAQFEFKCEFRHPTSKLVRCWVWLTDMHTDAYHAQLAALPFFLEEHGKDPIFNPKKEHAEEAAWSDGVEEFMRPYDDSLTRHTSSRRERKHRTKKTHYPLVTCEKWRVHLNRDEGSSAESSSSSSSDGGDDGDDEDKEDDNSEASPPPRRQATAPPAAVAVAPPAVAPAVAPPSRKRHREAGRVPMTNAERVRKHRAKKKAEREALLRAQAAPQPQQ